MIDIVLATFNGERFVGDQLNSIIACNGFETHIEKIIVSDDGSSDDTESIVRSYANKKIMFVKNNLEKGPAGNFFNGLEFTTSNFIMFSDQDDVWDKRKITAFISEVRHLDSSVPGAVICDLSVVDENLAMIKESFFQHERVPNNWALSLRNLFLQNCAPGCAMLLNRATVERMMPLSEGIIMHDWWALLYAALYKNVRVINLPLVKYRQHQSNAIGVSQEIRLNSIIDKMKNSRNNLYRSVRQAKLFYSRLNTYEKELLNSQPAAEYRLRAIATLDRTNMLDRIVMVLRCGKIKSTFLRNAYTWFLIICFGRR